MDTVRTQTERTRTERSAGKRYLVIRNGRGIIAEGDDMAELESRYAELARNAQPRVEGAVRYDFPDFGRLAICENEGETGKVCILDRESQPDAVKAYYNIGFIDAQA